MLAAARGRLSLLFFSKQARANDYYAALVHVAEQTAAEYPTLSPELRAVFEAYARGLASRGLNVVVAARRPRVARDRGWL